MGVARPARFVRFGPFQLDLRAGELRRNGIRVRVPDQSIQVLTVLVENPGEVVTREELQLRLWPDGTIVEFDRSINAAIKRLRVALEDSAEEPRFVETLPRRGYRFLVPVERGDFARPSGEIESQPQVRATVFAPAMKRRWVRLGAAVGLPALVTAIATGVWFAHSRSDAPQSGLAPLPLTSEPGVAGHPSFSPDGNQIVYFRRTEAGDSSHLYIKILGAPGPPRRLTNTQTGRDFSPAWSPDGRYIAFVRVRNAGDTKADVLRIPLTGSSEQKLTEVSRPVDGYNWPGPELAWFPDGRWLVTVDRSSPKELYGLFLLSVDTREKHRLTAPQPTAGNDDGPAVSPDAHWLAFSRGGTVSQIYLLELSADHKPKGEPKQITFENQHANSPAWTPDGRAIVFTSGAFIRHSLWRIAVSNGRPGKPMRMASAGEDAFFPAISPHAPRLVFFRRVGGIFSIWRADVPHTREDVRPVKLIFSTQSDEDPEYSPDGSRIAFKSTRSGAYEIWLCDRDGSNPIQLTSSVGVHSAEPKWSRDGQNILFSSIPKGHAELFLINAQGGIPKRLATGQSSELAHRAVFSRDGKGIYFVSDRTGRSQIWKMPADGDGQARMAVQVTWQGATYGLESPDGNDLYYVKEGNPSPLMKVPVGGGEEVQILPSVYLFNFTVAEEGIYFISSPDHGRFQLQFRSSSSGKITRITTVEAPGWVLSASPGARGETRSILYEQFQRPDYNLMLVEDFR